MNIKVSIHNRNVEPRIKDIPNWKISEQDKKDLIKFIEDLSLGKVNRGKKIGEARQLKYLDLLKISLSYLNKPSSKLKLEDTEKFEKWLVKQKYAASTKASIRLTLRVYLKWKLGEEKARKLTYFFDIREPKRTPDYLSEQEVEKLYKACKSAEERFLVAILFDSGARAEEFHNIRREDIQLPSGDENYVRLTLKEEYSKTSGRVISLYWKYSLEAVRDYLNERQDIRLDAVLFEKRYDNIRQFLSRLGKNVLGKSIHYHLFRHSSATHYAPKINRQQLCYRYGWRFSSNMPDIYISRSGMESKELDDKFSSIEMEDLKNQLDREKLKHELEIGELKSDLKELKSMTKHLLLDEMRVKIDAGELPQLSNYELKEAEVLAGQMINEIQVKS